LALIIEIFGSPTEEEINAIPREKSKSNIQKMPKKKPKILETLFPYANPKALDLLKKFMTFDPKKRITVEEALSHPYLEALHFP